MLLCRVTRPRFTADTLVIRAPEHVVLRGAIDGHNEFKHAEYRWHFEVHSSNGSTWNVSEEMMHLMEGKLLNGLLICERHARKTGNVSFIKERRS